jgi:hypothetical protein
MDPCHPARVRRRLLAALRLSPRVALVLLLLTALGGTLRAAQAADPADYQSVDEQSMARIARHVARYGEYGAPRMRDPFRWAPGAPLAFATAHQVRPATRGDGEYDVLSAYPLQAAVGTAAIPATFVLGALVAGPVAGLVAAGALAVYPALVRASGDLLTEPLGTLALVLALIAVLLALRRPVPGPLAAAGVLLGLAVLVRGDLLVLPFVLAAVTVALVRGDGASWRRAAGAGAVLAAAALAPLALWSAYATSESGRLVAVTSGGGSNLFIGTYLPGGGSIYGVKRELGPEAQRLYPRLRGQRPANLRSHFVLDAVAARRPELERDAALRREGLENLRRYALGQPLDFAGLAVRKVERLWLEVSVGNHRNPLPGERALHLVLVALGTLGLLLGLARPGPHRAGLVVLAAVLLYVTALNVVVVAEPRHNLPVMPVLLAGGAAGLAVAASAMRPARARSAQRAPTGG